MKGIADGSGLPLELIRKANLFPELTKASCTIIGSWGEATEGSDLWQLRALDWIPDMKINKNPAIIVYHSTEIHAIPFANIGYAGIVGSITAMNAKGIAIS